MLEKRKITPRINWGFIHLKVYVAVFFIDGECYENSNELNMFKVYSTVKDIAEIIHSVGDNIVINLINVYYLRHNKLRIGN